MSFWKNLEMALHVSVVSGESTDSISQPNEWINEMLLSLSDLEKLYPTLIRIAYDIGGMDHANLHLMAGILKIKALKDEKSEKLLNYIEYLQKIEGYLIQLTSVDSELNWADFVPKLSKMEYIEIAACYGLLKSYSKENPKAKFFCNKIEDFFKNKSKNMAN